MISEFRTELNERRADMPTLLSNLSEDGLTPDGLRRLAQRRPTRKAEPKPPAPRVHALERRLSAAAADKILERYAAGESATLLAKEYAVAPSALLRLLREHCVVVRRHGLTAEQGLQFKQEYEAGATLAELEKRHRLSRSAIRRALMRSGTTLRPTGRASTGSM